MPDLTFLDSKHPIYQSHEAAWKREERRLVGGDAILSELVKFGFEDTVSYAARVAWARWVGFAKLHTTILAGHLRRGTPLPNFGELGEVRSRADSRGKETLAELFHYNADGIGSDGSQLPAFMDAVEQRALATAYRWLMAEMPTLESLQAIRVRLGKTPTESLAVTEDEVRAGFRPYLVEYSPLAVTNWRYHEGVLCWAVVRITVPPALDFAGAAGIPASQLGYYVLVRKGYKGLGPDWEQGGWWKYDSQKAEVGTGDWAQTDGQIPMWLHIGEPGSGTYERPAIGQSSTMELGQISADLMNAVSEQRFNLRQAAKSINYWRGIDKDAHDAINMQLGDGSISVGVPFAKAPDGTYHIPELDNSSAFALDATTYQTVIDAAIAEAKEVMVRQVTSTPDASGVSKEAGFAEATSPLLARLAATAEQSWNTMLYFVARRFGVQKPSASVQLPREFELRNILDSIDQMLKAIQDAKVKAPTWTRALLEKKGDELDLLPDDERQVITDEMETEATERARLELSQLRAQVVQAWQDAGGSFKGALREAGVDDTAARELFPTQPANPPVPPVPPAPPATGTPGAPPPAVAPPQAAA